MTLAIHRQFKNVPVDFHVYFDCRLAVWDSVEKAYDLFKWRAHDAIVNGISDTVYHSNEQLSNNGLFCGTSHSLDDLDDPNNLWVVSHVVNGLEPWLGSGHKLIHL
jgi:hypothetical protein